MKHNNPTYSLLVVGLLAAILAQQNAIAQTTPPPEGTVNSPGSVLHGRTLGVARAILNKLPGIERYTNVTNTNQLSSITSLDLSGRTFTKLQGNDFDGLNNLLDLNLSYNHLRFLPSGIFDGLTNLQTLNLRYNQLASLPSSIGNLVNLRNLFLSRNPLASIPSGFFDRLTNLQDLRFNFSQVISLPAGIFDQLTNLRLLSISSSISPGGIVPLPSGIFDKLTNLRNLYIIRNLFSSLPSGTFDEFVNLRVRDVRTGNIMWESSRTQPSLPSVVDSPGSVLHGRTREVADEILRKLPGVTQYNQVTNANQLSIITSLHPYDIGLTTLQAGDFNGLANLQTLYLSRNQLTNLPSGIFDELANLQTLHLSGNDLTSLPSGIFDELANLQTLHLSGNDLTSLPSGIFDELANLQTLHLSGNDLTSLPSGIFDELANLQTLYLSRNQLTNLPSGIFDELANLQTLHLSGNDLTSLPSGIFDELANLQWLTLPPRTWELGIFEALPDSVSTRLKKRYAHRLPYISLSHSSLKVNEGARRVDRDFHHSGDVDDSSTEDGSNSFSYPPFTVESQSTLTLYIFAYSSYIRGIDFVLYRLIDGTFERVTRFTGVDGLNPLPFLTISLSPGVYRFVDHRLEGYRGGLYYLLSHYEKVPEVNAEIQVQLENPPSDRNVTFDYATQDGTAIAGQDYTAASGTITFPAGTTNLSQTISIPILDDNVDDPAEETFHLILRNPTNVLFTRSGLTAYSSTINIIEPLLEDPPTPILNFSQTAFLSILEGNAGITNAALNVQLLNGVPDKDVSVDYATQDGTAIAGEDYTETSGTLTFAAYTTNLTQTISIPILGDALDEPNEYFNLLLSNPTNAVIQPSTARIEIVNDDQEPLPPPVNVNNGGAVTPIITPFPSRPGGSTPSSLMFNTKQVSLSESGSATYQVKPTSLPARDITTVNLATTHSGITLNPSKLMFTTLNWQSYQTVTVTASADAADTNEQAGIQHSIPSSPGFLAINNAGIVSVTLSHTVVEEEEPETPSEEQQEVQQVQVPPTDYDQDDNGLIDVSNLAQLNAIRWDLNGDGQPDKEEFAKAYNQAFPSAIANMGLPNNTQAQGYELTTNLHFDSHKNNRADEADPFWNQGNGWQSIGVFANPFQAVLEGNNHGIVNLFQDQSDAALFYEKPSGLFGAIGNRGQVVNVGLEGVHIQGVNFVGALAGLSQGLIRNCSVRGRVAGANSVGGLVGHNFGHIADSHVHAAVLGNIGVGGLVGWNAGGLIEGSTAPGQEGQEESLGLVGFGTPAR